VITPSISGDSHDFRVVNDFARDTSWLHGFMAFVARDGIFLLGLALLAGWWLGRRDASPRRVALAVWAALAALVAVAIVQPISSAADEKRPFVVLPHVLKLISHANDAGFPSDHATAAGAVAAGLFFVSWRLGLVTAVWALLVAFSRVYVGVHFPQDVAAGLALGVIVAVIGVFLVVPLMSRIAEWLTKTPMRVLIVSS
jgi:membrane-associated phospholipid phosphatase